MGKFREIFTELSARDTPVGKFCQIFTEFSARDILQTLWWISFIFGMMVDIALKFLLAPSQPLGVTFGSRSRTSNFRKNVKIFVFKFI